MRKIFASSAIALVLALHSHADETVRSAQTILKDAGYYTGEATGELNADTKAALRRYQIRNQLQPTGELTPETMAALNQEGEPEPTPAPTQTPTVVPPPPSAVVPAPYSPPPPPVVARPDEPAPDYSALYARTPYAKAPLEVQRETLRKAQALLTRRGFYEGPVNGIPNAETEEALLRLQASRDLPRSGTLDIDTLAELHLMPISRRPIRTNGAPQGAVRGMPLD